MFKGLSCGFADVPSDLQQTYVAKWRLLNYKEHQLLYVLYTGEFELAYTISVPYIEM
jgi:hypothetical protein